MSTQNIILVSGATGQQGGATTKHLLARGWTVRALTRDASSSAAQSLADAGAEVVEGDLDDRHSLDRVLQGVYGVFSVQNFWLPGVGAEGEVRQGKNLADAAKAAGVRHFVYSSVGGAERNSGLAHFESKWRIELHIQSLGLPATIFRPVAFMENYNWSRPQILSGVYPNRGLKPDTKFQRIAVDDIGAFVALAFEDPEGYIGMAIELAGDESTEIQAVEIFSRVIGRSVTLEQPSNGSGSPPDPERARMIRWFNEEGYQADIPALRAIYPPLKNLETWLRETGWENAQPEPAPAAEWRN